MNLDWPGAPGGWEWLKRCASRHCPHRHLGIEREVCPCTMHDYLRTQAGLEALARVDRRRALYIANEWRGEDRRVSATRGD